MEEFFRGIGAKEAHGVAVLGYTGTQFLISQRAKRLNLILYF
jgi:hypothetical protein